MKKITLHCNHCDIEFSKLKAEYTRQIKKNTEHKFFCSRDCYKKDKTKERIQVTCTYCDKQFELTQGQHNRKLRDEIENLFCGRRCANKHLGENLSEQQKENLRIKAKQWTKDNYEKCLFWSNKGFETLRSRGRYFCSNGEIEVFDHIKENSNLKIQTGGCFGIGIHEGKAVRKQFDIYCRETKTLIEYDGACHFKPIYGIESFEKTVLKDRLLKEWCTKQKWSLVRIREEIYKKDKEYWLNILLKHIENQQVEYFKYY